MIRLQATLQEILGYNPKQEAKPNTMANCCNEYETEYYKEFHESNYYLHSHTIVELTRPKSINAIRKYDRGAI